MNHTVLSMPFRGIPQSWIRPAVLVLLVAGVVLHPVTAHAQYGFGHLAFSRTWSTLDYPAQAGAASRTWMWGPSPFTPAGWESYEEAPGGQRLVQYFDKSRMEINDPDAPAAALWYVTNGLLAVEMMSGFIQAGDAHWVAHGAAEVHVAGDRHPDTSTYATFGQLMGEPPGELGAVITQTVDRAGNISTSSHFAQYGVTNYYSAPPDGRMIPAVFWHFMTSEGTVADRGSFFHGRLFANPYYATGLPMIEAYWTTVPVGGQWKDVLTQCYERRCLTYTPPKPPGWQVEMGNIGQHYYQWRYPEGHE